MLTLITFAPSLIVTAVGLLILWSNPGRKVNWVIFSCSLHVALWMACVTLAIGHSQWILHAPQNGVLLLRLASALGAWGPYHLWIANEIIGGADRGKQRTGVWKNALWIAISLFLSAICFTNYYIPYASTATQRIRGWGYHCYIVVSVLLCIYVFARMFSDVKRLTGGKKLELQLWLGGGCATIFCLFVSMGLNLITKRTYYITAQPYIILLFYVGTAYAITSYRIFDAYQIARLCAHRAILCLVVSVAAYIVYRYARLYLPQLAAFVPTIVVALFLAGIFGKWLDSRFQFFPEGVRVREMAFEVARKQMRVDALEASFASLLKGWGQADHALIFSNASGALCCGQIELPEDGTIVETLREIQWATPERLFREKQDAARAALAKFLDENRLGVAVLGRSTVVTVLVGVGPTASRRPFTFPQVGQLIELVAIVEGALERAQLSAKMQHTEQLATVGLLGASLAHEIRNPLVTIKTFVQLLPSRYQDAIFRDKFSKLMGDEVARIDRLTEQLLDLASPRTYSAHPLGLHSVLNAGFELLAGRASDKQIKLVTELSASPDLVIGDPSAIKQVLLNLSFNAIQALDARSEGKWVKITTKNLVGAIEMSVSDNGPGIAPSMHARLFQPFQSTKSSGFGLGLAICRDILTNLGATISIDPPVPGCGATFRVLFPCPPSSS